MSTKTLPNDSLGLSVMEAVVNLDTSGDVGKELLVERSQEEIRVGDQRLARRDRLLRGIRVSVENQQRTSRWDRFLDVRQQPSSRSGRTPRTLSLVSDA